MDNKIFKLFHESSKQLSNIPFEETQWPSAWVSTHYKDYGLTKSLSLPKPENRAQLFTVIADRMSQRVFKGGSISIAELSTILKYSCGELQFFKEGNYFTHGRKKRAYPSGGALFPLEVYILTLKQSEGLPKGLYHYNVSGHALDVLPYTMGDEAHFPHFFSYEWVQNASAAVFFTCVFSRIVGKYGDRGYRYALLEAGHAGQNMYLASTELHIGCCGLGGTQDRRIERLLGLDGVTESLVHTVILGK